MAARIRRRPWVFAERSSPRDFGPHTGWVGVVHIACGRRADAIIANSSVGMEYWESHARADAHRAMIPNGLPIEAIDAVPPASASRLPPGAGPLILWAGRMDGNKNVVLVADAFARLLRERPDARAMLCGEGPERAAAEARIAAPLRDRVIFAGYRDDLLALMKASAVFVSMSAYEGNPNVVQEAMACRLPLVVSDIEAHRRVLGDAAALFVPPGDATALAGAIGATLADRATAAERARRARAVAESLSMDVVASATRRVYEAVTGR
jgi:glycosyltransferase involved in cell wall biosynthesis